VTLKTFEMMSYQTVFVFTLLTLPAIYSRPTDKDLQIVALIQGFIHGDQAGKLCELEKKLIGLKEDLGVDQVEDILKYLGTQAKRLKDYECQTPMTSITVEVPTTPPQMTSTSTTTAEPMSTMLDFLADDQEYQGPDDNSMTANMSMCDDCEIDYKDTTNTLEANKFEEILKERESEQAEQLSGSNGMPTKLQFLIIAVSLFATLILGFTFSLCIICVRKMLH
jgi:hypothetical protein